MSVDAVYPSTVMANREGADQASFAGLLVAFVALGFGGRSVFSHAAYV